MVDDSTGAASWFRRVVRAEVLLLDDVFKAKLTEQSEVALFCVVDERTAHGRPLVITTNDTGPTLASRLSSDRGEPMIRRLREFCDDVAA